MKRSVAWLLAPSLALWVAVAAWAHPYHASVAEVDLSPTSGHLEVALQVLPEDLELALAPRQGGRLPLEAPAADAWILAYLVERFEVRRPGGARLPLRWVGKQISARAAWLYFEVLGAAAEPELELANRVLFEVARSQANTVLWDRGERRQSFVFRADAPVRPVRLRPAAPPAAQAPGR